MVAGFVVGDPVGLASSLSVTLIAQDKLEAYPT
jgi:hypothetical protein